MAYFNKVKGGWRAQIVRKGVRTSRTYPTKAEAEAWATQEEAAILSGARREFPRKTVGDALDRYEREVIAHKTKTRRADVLRFAALRRDFPDLVGKVFYEVSAADLAAWRDERLRHVSGSSVLREGQQLRPVWNLAIDEWGWASESPWKGFKLPAKSHARTRKSAWSEVRLMLRSVGYQRDKAPARPQDEAVWAYLVALHTALRSGEILRMSRSTVDLQRRVYRLEKHKTDAHVGVRHVPFTRRAARVLAVLDRAAFDAGRDEYFTISDGSRDTLFRKVRDRLMVEGLRFHDARGTALTWLSKRYDVMTLARISGHTNINELYRTYYRETPESVAARL